MGVQLADGPGVFDVWDQATNTELVKRSVETAWERGATIGKQIAPLFPVRDRQIKLETMEIYAFGKGRFKAEDATPPIYTPKTKWTEEEIDLALLEEMTVVQESLLHKLKSDDEKIRNRAGADILTRGRALQLRNERLTEWMRWQAFLTGTLPIAYDDESGQNFVIDYQVPSTHFVTPTTPWTNLANSTPVDDLRLWQRLIANDAEAYGTKIHMDSDTYTLIEQSAQVRAKLTGTQTDLFLATREQIQRLLYEGTEIIVTDAGYREEAAGVNRGRSQLTKYLPYGKVLITTDYNLEGEKIADVADGLVAIQTDWNAIDLRPGMQSEVLIKGTSKTHFWRQASSRMVRLRNPNAFATATVI